MDLNDPRRRLQVLNQSNPSLRASVAPQQPLRVQTSAPQQLTIQTGDQNRGASPAVTINRDPNASTQAPNHTPFVPEKTSAELGLDFLKHTGSGIIDSTVKPFAEGVARLLPGGQNDLKANQNAIESTAANQKVYSDLYKAGKITPDQYSKYLQGISADSSVNSTEATRIADTADKSRFLGSAAQVAALPFLGAAEGAATLAGRIGLGAAEGGAMGLATEFSSNNDPTLKGAAVNTGIGALAGGVIPFLGGLKNSIAPSAKSVGISKSTLNELKGSNDVLDIFSKLQDEHGGVDPVALYEAAERIAKSENGKFIIKELAALPEQGIAAAGTGIVAGNIAAKEKYGVDTLTGDTAQAHIKQLPEEPRTIDLNPPSPNDGSPIQLNSNKVADEAFSKANDEALRELGITPPETPPTFKERVDQKKAENQSDDLSTVIKANAPEVAKDPALDKSMQEAFLEAGTKDPYNLLVQSISKNGNKSEIRGIVDKLVGDNSDTTLKNRLTKKLTNAKTPQEVHDIIDAETAAAKAATEAPTPNSAEARQEAMDAAPQQNGTVAPEVAADGSTVASKTEAASPPEQVSTPVNKAADSAAKTSAPESTPASPHREELLGKLDEANKQYKKDAKTYSKQLGQKFAAGSQASQDAGGGLAGYKAKLGAMKGKKQSGFQPMQVSEEARDALLKEIDAKDIGASQKLNAQTAILKVLGEAEGAPTPSDIKYIRDTLGDDVADAVTDNVVNTGEESLLQQLAGAPRTAMTIGDFSVPRQAGVAMAGHPIEGAKAFAKGIKFAFKPKQFDAATKAMAKQTDEFGENYSEFMGKDMNLQLPNLAEAAQEEAMSSAPLLEKIPGYGSVVRGSNRSFSGTLGELRYNIAKNWIDAEGGIDEVKKNFSEKELQDLGEVFNTMSGRGGKKGGLVDRHAATLSKTLFSGRLWASRLNLLNPYYYARLSPVARKEALKASASFAALAGGVLELASHMPGTEVEWNPKSADFAKIKVGNTRYDILGGLQQNIRVGAQMLAGEKVDSTTGETKDVTPVDALGKFVEGKLNPLLGYALKVGNDPNDGGFKDINPLTEAGKLLVPLGVSGSAQTIADTGNVAKGIGMNLPGVFGAGIQTYGAVPTKNKGKDEKGNEVYKGKVTDNMITDNNGQVILNDKGRPVTVEIPEGASKTEIAAIKDAKKASALSDQYKRSLSSEDQALMKLSDDKLKEYVKSGKIDQAHYDKLQNYEKTAKSAGGKGLAIPDGITTDQGRAFYEKYNTMNEKDQKAWLKQAPDDNAKTIASELNKMKAPELSEFKPSNELSKAYAEYEKDINTHPEYTPVDKNNKGKAFQVNAAKLNYNDSVKDIYNEGGNTDLKTLMSEKQISQEDLNNAIQLDNELYTSGLTGSLKFSKKFRDSMGVATPNGVGGASGGSDGSGSASDYHGGSLSVGSLTNNPAATKLPEFSTKSRGIKFTPPANIAKGASNSKRISIKL